MPTVYRDTDPSAPVLTGQVGSMIALLDACLVNGYGSKTAAGWTKPYTGAANQAVYLQGGSAPNRYFQVDDAAPHVTALARECRISVWETMSAYNTGTGQMNVGAFASGYMVIRKSATADATVRAPWVLVADQKTFYFWNITGDVAGSYFGTWWGDFYSFRPGNNFKCGAIGRPENSAAASNDIFTLDLEQAYFAMGCALRLYTGVAGAVNLCQMGDSVLTSNTNTAGPTQGVLNFPHSPDGGFYLSPLYLMETSFAAVSGKHRGIWHGVHPVASFADGNVIAGTGPYAGRTFMIVSPSPSVGSPNPLRGYSVVEITAGQWPSSA